MTAEDDFQAALDADPADQVTRGVFADWLIERGDPRGEGYRVMALTGRVPEDFGPAGFAYWSVYTPPEPAQLRGEWHKASEKYVDHDWCRSDITRRMADDAAALGWADLSDDEKRLILEMYDRAARTD